MHYTTLPLHEFLKHTLSYIPVPPHKPEDLIAIEPDPQDHQITLITVVRSSDSHMIKIGGVYLSLQLEYVSF